MLSYNVNKCIEMMLSGECNNCYIIEKEGETITSLKNEEDGDVLVYFWIDKSNNFIDFIVQNDDPFLFFEIIKIMEEEEQTQENYNKFGNFEEIEK